MSSRTPIVLSILLAAAMALLAWHEHEQLAALAPAARKVDLLSQENDALRTALAAAQQTAADAKNAVRRTQIERDTAAIRGLSFTSPVDYEVLDKAGIRQVVAGKLSEIYTDQEIRDMATGLSAFGLLPPNFPLKQTYIDLLGEQIAAFYDQHQHKLFMFRDASLENSQNRIILSHELTHALQDQNFGLLKMPLEIKTNDDEAAAASALIEGDATLEMTQYMQKDLSWQSLADTVTYSATQSMEQIRKAPRYLRQMLVFPYVQGQQFCAAVYARGGFPALNAVYADPPSSTAQILHPEKYFKETRENPIPVDFPDTTFRGQKPLANNVLGEMGCRILFAQADPEHADAIAAGWRGDRYLVFDNGKVLVWKVVWASKDAQTDAFHTFLRATTNRVKVARLDDIGRPDQNGPMVIARFGNKGADGEFFSIGHIGPNEVVFILAPDKESSDQLEEQFAGASHG
jgi:hypothetical protein